MKIAQVKEIGIHRPLCVQKIRVAEGLATRSSQYGAAERKRKGIPIDQCGARADFIVTTDRGGSPTPLCRAHAGQFALNRWLQGEG